MTQRQASVSAAIALGLIALGSVWTEARAQAWVGDKGALDLSFDYNLAVSDKVVVDQNDVGFKDFQDAGTTTHQFTLGAEYVPVNKLAFNVSLPLAILKLTGDPTINRHLGGSCNTIGCYDDGNLHATLTDLRAGARYQLLDEPFALGASLALSVPVADYETVGAAVAGRHLKAAHAGLGIGKLLGESAYVHLLYEFSLVEKYDKTAETKKHGQNHSDVAFTIGLRALDQRLDLHLDANGHWTHGGVNFSDFGPGLSANEMLYHDPILDEDMILVGGGVGYQISNQLVVNASARLFVDGQNTQNASVFALGFAYSFDLHGAVSPPAEEPPVAEPPADEAPAAEPPAAEPPAAEPPVAEPPAQ